MELIDRNADPRLVGTLFKLRLTFFSKYSESLNKSIGRILGFIQPSLTLKLILIGQRTERILDVLSNVLIC